MLEELYEQIGIYSDLDKATTAISKLHVGDSQKQNKQNKTAREYRQK